MKSLLQHSHIQFFLEMFSSAIDGIEWFVIAYVLCIIVFFVIGSRFLRLSFGFPLVFMMVTIFNPFLIVPVAHAIGLTSRFRRLFWLLPVNLVLAYVFTRLCTLPEGKKQKKIFFHKLWRITAPVCCIAFTVLLGTSARPYMHTPQNIYKTSNEVRSISAIIAEDAKAAGIKKTALYADLSLMELRQYDPTISNILRRKDLLNWELENTDDETIESVIRSSHRRHILALTARYGIPIDPKVFRSNMRHFKINYIITPDGMNFHDYFQQTGYEQIGTAGIYEIYRAENKRPGGVSSNR